MNKKLLVHWCDTALQPVFSLVLSLFVLTVFCGSNPLRLFYRLMISFTLGHAITDISSPVIFRNDKGCQLIGFICKSPRHANSVFISELFIGHRVITCPKLHKFRGVWASTACVNAIFWFCTPRGSYFELDFVQPPPLFCEERLIPGLE